MQQPHHQPPNVENKLTESSQQKSPLEEKRKRYFGYYIIFPFVMGLILFGSLFLPFGEFSSLWLFIKLRFNVILPDWFLISLLAWFILVSSGVLVLTPVIFRGYWRGLICITTGIVGATFGLIYMIAVFPNLITSGWITGFLELHERLIPDFYIGMVLSVVLMAMTACAMYAQLHRRAYPASKTGRFFSAFAGITIIIFCGMLFIGEVLYILEHYEGFKAGFSHRFWFATLSAISWALIFAVGILSVVNSRKTHHKAIPWIIAVLVVCVLAIVLGNEFIYQTNKVTIFKNAPANFSQLFLPVVNVFTVAYSFFFLIGAGLRIVLLDIDARKRQSAIKTAQ